MLNIPAQGSTPPGGAGAGRMGLKYFSQVGGASNANARMAQVHSSLYPGRFVRPSRQAFTLQSRLHMTRWGDDDRVPMPMARIAPPRGNRIQAGFFTLRALAGV